MAGVPPRGTPYNPLVVDVMEEVFGPTAGEDRPLLHPRAQPVVRSLLEIAADNPRFEAVQHACPSAFLSHANHAVVRLEWLRHHLSCESHGGVSCFPQFEPIIRLTLYHKHLCITQEYFPSKEKGKDEY
jgi:hypothetical protein